MSETLETYLAPRKIGETPEARAAQLRSLAKSPGYQMVVAELRQRRDAAIESLVRLGVRSHEDMGAVIALQVEARILTAIVGGYDMPSLAEEMLKEEVSRIEPNKPPDETGFRRVDNPDTEEGEMDDEDLRSPSPLL